jgi:hypothetical protein
MVFPRSYFCSRFILGHGRTFLGIKTTRQENRVQKQVDERQLLFANSNCVFCLGPCSYWMKIGFARCRASVLGRRKILPIALWVVWERNYGSVTPVWGVSALVRRTRPIPFARYLLRDWKQINACFLSSMWEWIELTK